jgi:hypothetical protein
MQRDKPAGKSGTTCPDDGKLRFYTRKDAMRYASQRTRRPGIRLRAYRCGQFWHLTSQDTAEVTWYRENWRRPA